MRSYFVKRWFMILTIIGIFLAVQYPAQTRSTLGLFEVRHVAAIGLFFMSATLGLRRLMEALGRPAPVLVALAISWGAAPLLAYSVAHLLLPEKYAVGLVIVCAVPCTLASAAVWTGMGGGNQAIALMMTLLTNTFVFLGTTGWIVALTGREVPIDTSKLIGELVLYVVLPIAVAQFVRVVPNIAMSIDGNKNVVKIIGQVCVLLILVKSAVRTSEALEESRRKGEQGWSVTELVQVGLVCGGVHTVLLVGGYLVSRGPFGRADALAVAISGSQKTLPVAAIIVAENFAHAPLAIVPVLFYHVGQLMIDTYFIEILARADAVPGESELVTS